MYRVEAYGGAAHEVIRVACSVFCRYMPAIFDKIPTMQFQDSSELKEKLEKALADGNTDAVRDGDLALPVPPMKMMTESM